MSVAREKFRAVLSRPDCTLAANIFDPLSARIAHMLDYEVYFLSGWVHKVANLAVPDVVLVNMSDLVDVRQHHRYLHDSDECPAVGFAAVCGNHVRHYRHLYGFLRRGGCR